MNSTSSSSAISVHYHLPGLFEFHSFYEKFLSVYTEHRDWFYGWCDIGSVYGAPSDCLWGGGRAGFGDADEDEVLSLMEKYGISSRLTFSNSLIREGHLNDRRCNALCRKFSRGSVKNGIIIHSDLLMDYIREKYPDFYFVSSTTKVITDFSGFRKEAERADFQYVVPDFRLNGRTRELEGLPESLKAKTEFLCNECCWTGCTDRAACYESVSRRNLGEECDGHRCTSPDRNRGYRFSDAMKNPSFIGVEDILEKYVPMGFSNFKIEGRSLGSAIILEFLLYYMTRPEHQLEVREEMYLDSTLDLF